VDLANQGKLLVTGADGFIGHALCARLSALRIAYVAAVRSVAVRDAKSPQFVALGDFAAADWAAALCGVSAVVHLAGRAHVLHEPRTGALTPYVVANVHVTRRLAEAAVVAGVQRIVFASTVKVYGERTPPGRPFRAGDPAAPLDAYAQSKAEAEKVLHEICRERGMEAVCLRLPLTYGAGVKGNFLALLEAVAAEQWLPLAGIANRRSLLYVGNAVSAIEAALAVPALAGQTLPIADAESVSTSELVDRLASALGLSARTFRVPPFILRAGAAMAGRAAAVDRLLDSLEVDATRFHEMATWSPPYPLEQGLAATVAWWRLRHAL